MKQNLYACETAAAMWTKLDTQYQLRAAENLHLLWQSFYDFTHHAGTLTQCKIMVPRLQLTSSLSLDDDMTTHIQKLTSISDKLKELGQSLYEMQLVTKALATLPEKFRVVRSVWASVPLNERTIDNLLQRLRSEENVFKSYEKEDAARDAAAKDAAYATQSHPSSRGRGRGRGRGGKPFHKVQEGFVNQHKKRMVLAADIVSFMVMKPMNAERKREQKPNKRKNRIKASCHLPNPTQQVPWTSSLILEPLSICLTKNICFKISHLSHLAHGSFPELAIPN